MRTGLVVLACLATAATVSAQRISDAPAVPASLPADALLVSADPASCLVPSTLNLTRIEGRRSDWIASRQTGACRWLIEGLPAGVYEIGLTHARGSGGRVRFNHVAGPGTELLIPAPKVTLTGVVRINGQPVPGAKIMFMGRPVQDGLPSITTDAMGAYIATLPDDGLHSMRLSGADVFGQGTSATFAEGTNRYDWDVTGGTLVIRDARGSRDMQFNVEVQTEGNFQGWSVALFQPAKTMRGAPFATHVVSVRHGSGPAQTVGNVTLSPDVPEGEVVIDVP